MPKIIHLTKGMTARVDAADFPRVSRYKWHVREGYAKRQITRDGKRVTINLSNFILGVPNGRIVDHKSGDRLDNRRRNLRRATRRQNCQNRKTRRDSKSGIKGVRWHAHAKKWTASILIAGKRHYLGYFSTSEKAARAYRKASRSAFGEFARF